MEKAYTVELTEQELDIISDLLWSHGDRKSGVVISSVAKIGKAHTSAIHENLIHGIRRGQRYDLPHSANPLLRFAEE